MNDSTPPEHNHHKRTGLVFYILMWLMLFGFAVYFFDRLIGIRYNPNAAPQSQLVGEQHEVVLRQSRNGHFVATGQVNGEDVVFLLDTGATDVVLGERTATAAGLVRGAPSWAMTANGRIRVYDTRISTLSLGGIELRNVRASINPHMDDDVALLGMSFLGQLEWTQKGDTLTLRH